MKQNTIKDIAKRLGINHSTVSRALHADPQISKATRELVLRTAMEMDYSPNTAARALVGARSNTIAIVTPAYHSIYSAEVMRGIEPEIIKTSYEMDYYTTRRFTVVGTAGRDVMIFEKILSEKKADALISITGNVTGRRDDILARYKKAGIHVIFVEGRGSWGHRVHYDNSGAAVMAVNHLVERKRKRIGIMIGDPSRAESYNERLEGFKKAMQANGRRADESNIFIYSEDSAELHRTAMNFFISNKMDAIYVAAGESYSLRVYQEGLKLGIKFPDDMALVSQDDVRISAAAGFTCVRQPIIEMGRKAVEIAVRAIEGKDLKNMRDEMFYPELMVRKSS